MNVAVKDYVAEQLSDKVLSAKEKYEGRVFNTNNYGDVVVLEYISSRDITIRFINTGNIRKVFLPQLKSGKIRDNELKPVYKVGIMDIPNAVGTRDHPKSYVKWNAMLQRCYNENMRSKHTTYSDCEVSDDFKYYSKFKDWAEKQVGYDQEGWCLDKDILVKGNKVYSAETCCFVPPEINSLLTTTNKRRGDTPIGVCVRKKKKGYQACLCINGKDKHLGSFDCPIKAFEAYKVAREAYYKEKAEQWKGKISDEAYEALKNRKVEITD